MTTSLPQIEIPTHLLPSDGRFGCGPSKVRPEAVASLAAVGTTWLGTSHRQPGVKNIVGRLRDGLASFFTLPDGYEIALGNGGATLFWDVATFSLIENRSAHLALGEFSAKFADASARTPHLDEPVVSKSEPGSRPSHAAYDTDAYCYPHNETSTGVMVNVERPGAAEQLVLVDATSAAGGLPVDIANTDAYYFAPQKCFASDGGLWVAALSPSAVARAQRLSGERWIPATLDLWQAIEQSRMNQTLNTPSLATLWLFAAQLEWMLESGGLAWATARTAESAGVMYAWADKAEYATPFVTDSDARSAVVTTIDLDQSIDANMVSSVLRHNGIVDTESYRKLGRNQIRMAMFPAIDPSDVEALCACIDFVVDQLASTPS